MEAIKQAFEQVGFTVKEMTQKGEDVTLTLVRGDMTGQFTMPLSTSSYGIMEAAKFVSKKMRL